MGSVIKCPECGSTRVWKVGVVPTRKGMKTRYKCTKCARTFYYVPPKPKATATKRPVSLSPRAFKGKAPRTGSGKSSRGDRRYL